MRRRVAEPIRRIARSTRAFRISGHGPLLVVLLLALAAALPLFANPGLLNTRGGGDSPFLLQRVQQLSAALGDGHFPVRWMPDANYGYGYPFFHYYAPLSIYVAAFFRFLGASYVVAIRFAQLAGFLLAAAATYALARRWFHSAAAGVLAAAAYTLAPFHLVNVYARGDSLAEFWAMAFYPLVFLAAERLLTAAGSGRLPAAAFLALSYAGLMISHNISALIFSPFLLLFLAVRLLRHPEPRRTLLLAAAALAWGLALAAWFWLPALAETGLAQTGPVTSGYFHYAAHFRSADLVQPALLFSYDVLDGAAFRMGLVQALLVIAGLLVLLLTAARLITKTGPGRGKGSPAALTPTLALFVLFSLALATLMITPLSRFLWDRVPLLPYTQFPWRFLSVQAFFGALVAAALVRLPYRRWWLPPLLLLLLIAALGDLKPDYLPLRDDDITPARLAEYEWFSGNIGTTVSAEYLPHAVQPRPYSSAWLTRGERDSARVLKGEAAVALVERQATRQRWAVSSGEQGATLLLPTLYWPGWQATLDGASLPLQAAPGSGLITVDIPPGDHQLAIHLAATPLRTAAEALS
ncbi:MAG: 6-pyruvoyl-tetrahydropterin synthase-related protein, partial [Anaerolineae bacterium]|nr:6-pyruvoyl-tetrahydropterin synthase-related protein [Anaerolineae bacterium]